MSNAENDRRMDYIEFPVRDLGETKRFYTAVFGWTFTDYGPDYTSFHDGRLGGGFNAERKALNSPASTGPLIVLYATDLEAAEAKVKSAGGKITDHHTFPGGRRFHFIDPSGNELAVWSDNA